MKRRQFFLRRCALAVVLVLGSTATAAQVGLVGHWTFDEGQGTMAFDSSGNGLDGMLRGNPAWVPGQLGGSLSFNGSSDYVEVPDHPLLALTEQITIAAWTNMKTNSSGEMAILSKGGWAANDLPYELTEERGAVIFWQFYNDAGRDTCSPTSPPAGEWHHIAATYDGQVFKCYIDGVLGEQWAYAGLMPKNTAAVTIGRRSRGGTFFNGMIDDVQLWSRALSEVEVGKIMWGLTDPALAQDPIPENEAVDVPFDTVLSWTPGKSAGAHDVYFGTTFADVNTADRANPLGLLVGQDQAEAQYQPTGLEYGRTYFWRVDEINTTDATIYQGQTWSFTVEPFAYPVTNVIATASSAQNGMGPMNTVNGSGLNEFDEHSAESTQMWMSAGTLPNWIRYEFDAPRKLHELWVWNSNQLVETFLGFGAKNVTIEYSVDGQTWATLEGVPQFTKAPGRPAYKADTVVPFGGVTAQYVKLTIDQNWGGVAPQTGLSEVRFFAIPLQARVPQPAAAATDVPVDTALNWRPGREATSHKVSFGADENALAVADTVTEHSYTPAPLDFATTYYWKVDEIGDTGTYEGEVWSFTTQEFAAIDDFEGYDDIDNRIYDAWIDGLTSGASGSQVGYDVSPFAERTIVHGGKQAMPFKYNNEAAPFYSEAEREFSPVQNWTTGGATALSLWVQGAAANSPTDLYLTVEDSAGKKATATNATAVASTNWTHWTIPQSSLAGVNLTKVKKIYVGVGNKAAPAKGGAGTVFLDDIGYGRPLP